MGEMVAIMAMRAFPLREDCKMRVNLLSRYGIWPLKIRTKKD